MSRKKKETDPEPAKIETEIMTALKATTIPKVTVSTPLASAVRLNLLTFLGVTGVKPDQAAGFIRWMTTQKHTVLTLDRWKEVWTAFQKMPA